MTTALRLLALQGLIGAFDTLYFHEWRARLPARCPAAAPELYVHAARAVLYAVLFGTLPFVAWQGSWVYVLSSILLAEIILTLTDFVVEIEVRKALGDVYAGERVTHAVMGIIYGAMIANLVPTLLEWRASSTALAFSPPDIPMVLRAGLVLMSAGVLASGLRDFYAALGLPRGNWPWPRSVASPGKDGP